MRAAPDPILVQRLADVLERSAATTSIAPVVVLRLNPMELHEAAWRHHVARLERGQFASYDRFEQFWKLGR